MNNMMLMGTERKNFDFALLKTMGASKSFVIFNLLFSSLKYVIVSNMLAFPFAYIVLGMISRVFEYFFGYSYDVVPTFGAVLGAVVIGVLVPVISSISPIWSIINNDLVENLNPIRNKTEAIHTEVYI
jgi:ABC-type antimicrobial peptide transport system permease subunit